MRRDRGEDSMMKTICKRFGAAFLSTLLAWPHGLVLPAGAQEKPVILESIQVSDDQLKIKLSGAAQYNSFLTATPPRLVIELLNTEYQAGAKTLEGKGRFLKKVRSGQFERAPRMVSRIVIDLNGMAGYRVGELADGLVVGLVSTEETAAPAAAPAPEPEPAAAAAPAPIPAPVAAAAPIPAEAAREMEQVLAVAPPPAPKPPLPKVSPKPALPRVSPKAAKAPEAGSGSTEMDPDMTAMATQSDINKTAASRPAEALPKPSFPAVAPGFRTARPDIMSRLPKDLVTLDFENTDIRDIIKLLGAKAKVNIIYGPDVMGSLSLHLTDVPFTEAFRTILSMMGLATVQVGDNILRVLTPANLAKSGASDAKVTKIVPLNYSKATEMALAVNAVRAAEGRTGTTNADIKTNSLIITESLEGLAATERVISQLDVRPQQVLIEAKLVEIALGNTLSYGVQWDYFGLEQGKALGKEGSTLIGGKVTAPTSLNSAMAIGTGFNDRAALNAQNSAGYTSGSTGVNLPSAAAFGGLSLGRITNSYILNASLTAAAAQGKVKVLSNPKIATLNNQPANITVSNSTPYVTSNISATGSESRTVTYVVTGIKLTVTPTINADGRITLDIFPDISSPGQAAPGTAPLINARSAKTLVLVKDGETIIIGGLIQDSSDVQIQKIPLLGDIPILGWLFRRKSTVRNRSELLIFVTPKILPD